MNERHTLISESRYIAPMTASSVFASIESRRQPPLFNSLAPNFISFSSEISRAISANFSFLTSEALSLVSSPSADFKNFPKRYSELQNPKLHHPNIRAFRYFYHLGCDVLALSLISFHY